MEALAEERGEAARLCLAACEAAAMGVCSRKGSLGHGLDALLMLALNGALRILAKKESLEGLEQSDIKSAVTLAESWLERGGQEGAPEALALFALAAKHGVWGADILDPSGPCSIVLHSLLNEIESCELDRNAGARGAQRQEQLDRLLALRGSSEELGRAMARAPKGEATALAFAKAFDSAASNESAWSNRSSYQAPLGSNLTAGWVALGALKERPELANLRDAEGFTVIGRLNEALLDTNAWAANSHEVSEKILCEMIALSNGADCLIQVIDPLIAAATPAVRAAAEAAELRQLQHNATLGSVPRSRL